MLGGGAGTEKAWWGVLIIMHDFMRNGVIARPSNLSSLDGVGWVLADERQALYQAQQSREMDGELRKGQPHRTANLLGDFSNLRCNY